MGNPLPNTSTDNSNNLHNASEPPPWPGGNRRLLLGAGAPIQPLVRLGTFSDEEFEIFVLEWIHDYLSKKYYQVQRRGGAGDKGRDIVAWIDPPKINPRRWDNYQCKHYKDPLAPAEFWVELGKLCYNTYIGAYTIPEHYFILTHKGIGPKLSDLIDTPDTLREELIKNWDSHCRDKITATGPIKLEGGFKAYVEAFDFSIVEPIPPMDLIEQHSKTRYHALIFGTALKPRIKPLPPPSTIATSETHYVTQIYEAYADHLKAPVSDEAGFKHRSDLKDHFDKARVCFYTAESLKEFARDNLPDDSYFNDLCALFLEGLFFTLNDTHPDGYHRMRETSKTSLTIRIDASVLRDVLRPDDRVGICHHLANDDKIHWVKP